MGEEGEAADTQQGSLTHCQGLSTISVVTPQLSAAPHFPEE